MARPHSSRLARPIAWRSSIYPGAWPFPTSRLCMMHGPAPPPALTIEGVSYAYGTRPALADVTFAIAPATFAVLLGLNGAGKTTLFSLITRLFATNSGHIRIFG